MSDIEPVPAATVVLVRQSQKEAGLEVLLLQRNSRLVFHGGHWVFPGGRIDEKDYKDSAPGMEYPAALQAAVRETKEEAGLDIDANKLIHTAHWTTPPKLPRRFCTWFFICPIFDAVNVAVDNDEILDHRWISPKAAIADAEAEHWVLPRPTLTTLSDIVHHQNLDELVAAVTVSNIRIFPKDSEYYRPAEMGYPE
jgi:8-oxo-dGTP pyrophosphatase MutT (NUDIX family)